MGNGDAHLLHRQNRLGRWRCGSRHHANRLRERLPLGITRTGDHRHDDRRAAKMRYTMLCESVINSFSRGATQEHVGARQQRDRPRKAPPVTVKERQRPQIHRMMRHLPGHYIVDRIGPGTAMGVHHALGLPGRPRGVIQRQRIPLIIWRGVRKVRRTLCQ